MIYNKINSKNKLACVLNDVITFNNMYLVKYNISLIQIL